MQRRKVDLAVLPYFLGCSLVVTSVLATLAYSMPPSGIVDDELDGRHRVYLVRQYLRAAALREHDLRPATRKTHEEENHEGGTGTRARNEGGKLGSPGPNPSPQARRFGRQLPQRDTPGGRSAELEEARQFGIIGLLSGTLGDPWAPAAPWHDPTAAGNLNPNARGNLWAGDFGDALGLGGLDLTGVGEGGGGRGEGLGLGHIGAVGSGAGTGSGIGFGPNDGGRFGWGGCGGGGTGYAVNGRVLWTRVDRQSGQCAGFGHGHGRLRTATLGFGSGVKSRGKPRVSCDDSTVSGHLPAEVIQRVVRQNHGRFRLCYQDALNTNPGLTGRVAVRFVIARDGSVSLAADAGSDLPDPSVTSCVVRAFYGLSFPAPEDGIVTVTYPLVLTTA